ncbi:MAG TPA: alkane 1-monooxygenase, partial [Novosphingobium sp.]|nr:alkane 1-monooxygenase [Novosphingobium sp.]
RLAKPHAMAGMNVLCAETDEEAWYHASSMDQSFVALRTGTPGRLKPPVAGYRESLPPHVLAGLDHTRQVSAIGSRDTVRAAIAEFVERTGVDELIVAGATFDPAVRRRSLVLTMEAIA